MSLGQAGPSGNPRLGQEENRDGPLAPVHSWFNESLDTHALEEAKSLLQEPS
jgi:hypothetical protein